jgi:hypothetical protein
MYIILFKLKEHIITFSHTLDLDWPVTQTSHPHSTHPSQPNLLHPRHIPTSQNTRIARSPVCRIIQRLHVRLPLRHIHANHPTIIRHQPIDLAFDIRRLRPHAARAGVKIDLLAQLIEQVVRAVVPVRSLIGEFIRCLLSVAIVPRAAWLISIGLRIEPGGKGAVLTSLHQHTYRYHQTHLVMRCACHRMPSPHLLATTLG